MPQYSGRSKARGSWVIEQRQGPMSAPPVLAALICGLALALAACGGSPASAARPAARRAARSAAPPAYALLQMNLCLSGLAGCYARTDYPAVVSEAVTRIRAARPDAVTVN